MTQDEWAARLWSLLALAARSQLLLSYTMVQKLTGLPRVAIGHNLSPIQKYCQDHKLPKLNSIVISEKTGFPTPPGCTVPPNEINEEHRRVFVFDWLGRKCPFPRKHSD